MSTTTTLNLGYGETQPRITIHTYPTRSPIAAVSLDNGRLEIIATSAADLTLLADTFTAAAQQLTDEAARDDVDRQQAAADAAAQARADADADAQALGFCDDDCRSEIETDALLEEVGR